MRIESYHFGLIRIDGGTPPGENPTEYRQDLIVFPDKIKSNWWRKQGHSLAVEDVRDVIEF